MELWEPSGWCVHGGFLAFRTGLTRSAVSLFFDTVVHAVGNLHMFKGPTRRLQRVRLFLRSFVLYRPWIPGEHRREICAVECVTAHLRTNQTTSTGTVISTFVCTVHALDSSEHRREICAVELQHIFVGLKRTRDQKLSSGLMSGQFSSAITGLMLLMFLTAHLFQFRFVDSEQYCNMALRLRCRRHEFLVVRLLSCACHLFSCELWVCH